MDEVEDHNTKIITSLEYEEFEMTHSKGTPPEISVDPLEEESTKKSITKAEAIAWCRMVSRFLMWTICTIATIVFTWSAIGEYLEDNPVTIITYMDRPEYPEPIEVKICNMVFLDSDKILNYKGDFVNHESYKFLHGIMSGNSTVNNLEWVLTTTTRDYFMLSAPVLREFSTDINEFVIGCYVLSRNGSCMNDFKWHLDQNGICYKASIRVNGYGPYNTIGLFLYFDPSKTMGVYSTTLGAFGSISQAGGTLGSHDGFFLAPRSFLVISGAISYRHQSKSFKKSKCVHRSGLETHDFTGEPFQTEYDPRSCSDLCYMDHLYKSCKCSFLSGWNLTNTECLEDRDARLCLRNISFSPDKIQKSTEACRAKCLSKCEQHNIELTISEVDVEIKRERMLNALTNLAYISSDNVLAGQLLNAMTNSSDPDATAAEISQNYAQFAFYLQSDKPDKHVEIIPIMTLSTFLGNLGGLIGMWLGVSAISVIELVETMFFRLISRRTCAFFRMDCELD